MATKRQPKRQPNGNRGWQPPRGITFGAERPGRPNPFPLVWRGRWSADGTRKFQAFATATEREQFARDLVGRKEQFGTDGLNFDPVRWRSYLELEKLCEAEGSDPRTVFMEWRDLKREKELATGATVGMTVAEAWPKYSELRKKEDELSDDTWRHINLHVGQRFVGALGTVRLNALSAVALRRWVEALKNPRTGEPMDPVTMGHHLKDVRIFLERCVREGWMLKNPADLVKPPRATSGNDDGEEADDEADDNYRDPIPVKDAFTFFKLNVDSPVAIRTAMEAFGGVRYKTAARLKHEHFNFEERGVELPGNIHKSGRRKFRQGHPDCLWAWLELAKDANHAVWTMTLRQYAEAKRMALTNAGLREFVATTDAHRETLRRLRNVWRRSFASYRIARTKNVPLVAYQMQHKRTATTEIYEGRATERDAVLYEAITPENVRALTWEEFLAKFDPKPKPAAA